MNQYSPNWGNQAYSYIQAVTHGITTLDSALHSISNVPENRLFTAIAFWGVVNDPEMLKSFYEKNTPSQLTLTKIVAAFMNEETFAKALCLQYWQKNCRGASFKTLIKYFLSKQPIVQYPTCNVPVVYIYHQKHVFVAEKLKNKFPDLHAICRSKDITVNLPVINLPKPKMRNLHRFMKQFPYPENIAWQYCAMQALFKKMKIEKLLTIEGTSPMEIAAVLAANSHGIETICIQYGWPPYLHAGFRNLPYHSFWCWGEAFRKKLAFYNPKTKCLNEGYHSEYQTVDIVVQKNYHFHLLVALQGPVGYIQPENWVLFLDLINALSALSIDVWVKEHPQIKIENIETLKNVTIYTGDGSIQQALLKEADAVLGIYSSTMIEAPLFNCVPIIFNPTDLPSIYNEITEYQVGIECRKIQEVLDAVKTLLLPENKQRYLKNMNAFRAAFFNQRI